MDCGRFSSQGKYTFPDGIPVSLSSHRIILVLAGSKYEGQFENGMFHGHGKLILEQGVYIGEWKEGKVKAFVTM
jgi:hypothetical protein